MAMPVKINPREETARSAASELYLRDTFSWAMQQSEAPRLRDFESVDWESVIEEIEDVARRDQDRWVSYCARAVGHLLKIEYWEPADEADLRHWADEINNFRLAMALAIRRNPELKGHFSELFRGAWADGRLIAKRTLAKYQIDRGVPASDRDLLRGWDQALPKERPYSLDEVSGCDPRREDVPRHEWPPGVAEVLTLRLGVKRHVIEPASRRAGRNY